MTDPTYIITRSQIEQLSKHLGHMRRNMISTVDTEEAYMNATGILNDVIGGKV